MGGVGHLIGMCFECETPSKQTSFCAAEILMGTLSSQTRVWAASPGYSEGPWRMDAKSLQCRLGDYYALLEGFF